MVARSSWLRPWITLAWLAGESLGVSIGTNWLTPGTEKGKNVFRYSNHPKIRHPKTVNIAKLNFVCPVFECPYHSITRQNCLVFECFCQVFGKKISGFQVPFKNLASRHTVTIWIPYKPGIQIVHLIKWSDRLKTGQKVSGKSNVWFSSAWYSDGYCFDNSKTRLEYSDGYCSFYIIWSLKYE